MDPDSTYKSKFPFKGTRGTYLFFQEDHFQETCGTWKDRTVYSVKIKI